MARPILCSQEDLNAVEMQDVTSEGHNTLAQDVRDAGPPKRITTENDNNNAKVAAQAEEKGGEDDDDDDDSDDDDNDDTEEEEREEGESEDSDLESSDAGLNWMCSWGSRDFSSILGNILLVICLTHHRNKIILCSLFHRHLLNSRI